MTSRTAKEHCFWIIPLAILVFSTILSGCGKERATQETRLKTFIVSMLHQQDKFKQFQADDFTVEKVEMGSQFLNGNLFELSLRRVAPPYYFYVLKNGDSLFYLRTSPLFEGPPKPNILEFIRFDSIATLSDASSFVRLFLRVITDNYPDSIISNWDDTNFRVSRDDRGRYVTGAQDKRVYLADKKVTRLQFSRSDSSGYQVCNIVFWSVNRYRGDLMRTEVELRDDGKSKVIRRIEAEALRGWPM